MSTGEKMSEATLSIYKITATEHDICRSEPGECQIIAHCSNQKDAEEIMDALKGYAALKAERDRLKERMQKLEELLREANRWIEPGVIVLATGAFLRKEIKKALAQSAEHETREMTDKPAVQDFGWANGWHEDPELVKQCQLTGHKTIEINKDPTHHGLETEVRCDICGYVYRYDSSG